MVVVCITTLDVLRIETLAFALITVFGRSIYYVQSRRLRSLESRPPPKSALVVFPVWYVWMLLFSLFPSVLIKNEDVAIYYDFWLKTISAVLIPTAIIVFVWTISTLGRSYSMAPSIKKNQKLVENGPYKFVRHPMYSSYFICLLALILATQNLILLLLIPPFGHAFYSSAKIEEALLEKAFGDSYRRYKERTGMFFPRALS